MLLLTGLGNPGKEYRGTRHNAGKWLVNRLKPLRGFVLRQTAGYMNNSGPEVKRLLDETGIPLDNLIVAHDDLDIKLGEFKLQKGRGGAGHKGVQSIIDTLGTRDFWRLRIGIDRPPQGVEAEGYVLQPFSSYERLVLKGLLPYVESSLQKIPPAKSG